MTERQANLAEVEVGYSEALATWTTRYLDQSGFECMLSIQAETGLGVLQKAEGAITYLTEIKCVPFRLGNNNGNGARTLTIGDSKQDSAICPIHNVPMKRWTKGDRSWYSHRWEGGWCKGGKA